MGANRGYTPIPIYGPCNRKYDQQAGEAAEIAFEHARQSAKIRADEDKMERKKEAEAQTDLERRKYAALLELKKAGNPGTLPRRVVGQYEYTLFERWLGKSGHEVYVDAEPAWPIGTFRWEWSGSHGVDHVEDLATGYTPSGRYVPMQYGTEGDDVHILYRKHRIRKPGYDYSHGPLPTSVQLVEGLERAVKSIRRPKHND
ncbi:hypothetical protein [Amycolatopsis sp. WAC 04182]|uniref:hypothetical protein n=1 Tax=Amycolatopsis sp. WAC 04182 TaxID=2203198 RepID=UPI000F779B23|nr:hypothetical protein [Amycolatopsis sp. WAC 04182]